MHPEIRQDGPGECPICGMALEPVSVGVHDGPNPELADMRRRLRVAAVLSLPLVVLAMVPALAVGAWVPWVELALRSEERRLRKERRSRWSPYH